MDLCTLVNAGGFFSLLLCFAFIRADQLPGELGDVGEFDSCQGIMRVVSGNKSCERILVAVFTFGTVQVLVDFCVPCVACFNDFASY